MAKPKPQQHTSKSTDKATLPPLQRKIIVYLANNEPKTKNELVKAIKGHYKSTWMALGQLEKKKLVSPVATKIYKGQEYSRFWVTGDGAFIALCEGANPDKLLKKTLEIYPNNRDLQYTLESVSILGPKVFKFGHDALIEKGKIDEEDFGQILAKQVMAGISAEQLIAYEDVLKKYPEKRKESEPFIKQVHKELKNLESTGNVDAFLGNIKPKKSRLGIFRRKRNKI